MADRSQLSLRSSLGVVSRVIKAGGGDLEDFNLNISTVKRSRDKARKVEYDRFYQEFQPPKHSVLGWDGKIVPAKNIFGTEKNIEYLAIVISGAPNLVEGKVMEVEEITSSSGQVQADAIFHVVEACGARDHVRALLFDTTNPNTGVRRGAASRLLCKFGRPLLWLECRHHTGELIIKPVWIFLFGDSQSPNIQDFVDFKKIWPYLKKDHVVTLSLVPGLEEDLKNKTVNFLQNLLTNPNRKQQLPRCDYEEVCKLTLLMLGAEVPGGFSWRRPGQITRPGSCPR